MQTWKHGLDVEGNGPYRLLRGVQEKRVQAFVEALERPEETQRTRLERILVGARATAFGVEHRLDEVRDLEAFRQAVPIRGHAELRPWLDRVEAGEDAVLTTERPTMLLQTSGTTGRPKHLPVTPAWADTVGWCQAMWVLGLLREHEAASKGTALTVVSPAEHARSAGGLPIGSNTGRMHLAQPWWLRMRYPVPYSVFALGGELKLYCILRFALQADIRTITTANPSTVLLLCRKLLEWREPLSADLRDGTLRHGPAEALDGRFWLELRLKKRTPPGDWRPGRIWDLCSVNCWKGGPAAYFVDLLPAALGREVPIREVGVTASEGYFAIPLSQEWPGSVLFTPGHFLEFVGDDGAPRGAWQLEPGEELRLVVTTEAGLYRYDLDDPVQVVGMCRRTPMVRFLGKGSRMLNALGERVSQAQATEAVRASVIGTPPTGFTVGIRRGEVPHYRVAVEGGVVDIERFDRTLSELNVEFQGRRGSGRMGPSELVIVPEGTFGAYRDRAVAAGAPDGQVKDPVLALDDDEWRAVVGET